MDEEWGFISKEGDFIVEPQYDEAYEFCEGLAPVKTGDKWGYIDKEGKFIIEPQFDDAWWDFSEGLARIKKNGKFGYINKEGKIVIEPQLDGAYDFSEGLAPVKVNGKWGFMTKEKIFVLNPQFDDVRGFNESIALIKQNGKWGFVKNPLTAKGKIENYEKAGTLIGTIFSISGNEVIVAGKIAEKVRIFDKLCTFSGEKMIVLRADFPMMTTSKCRVISGSIKDLQKGMKVYLYSRKEN